MEIRMREGTPMDQTYVLAARITGKLKADEDAGTDAPKKGAKKDDSKKDDTKKDDAKSDSESSKSEKSSDKADKSNDKGSDPAANRKSPELDVVLVADADLLASLFFDTRARRMPDNELEITTDNVTFVLNVLDVLADDQRFINVRKRRPTHRPLSSIVDSTQQARDDAEAARAQFEKERQQKEQELEEQFTAAENKLKAEIKEKQNSENPNQAAIVETAQKLAMDLQFKKRQKEVEEERLRKEAQRQIDQSAVDLNAAIRHVQNQYKFKSVFFPPMLPLAVAFLVYFNRRAKEREGVSKARLR